MPSRKDRLYVALYVRGGQPKMAGLEDTYHWALLIGPKAESYDAQGHRCHAKETVEVIDGAARQVWGYEEREISMAPTNMILVRVVVGKVADKARLLSLLRAVPIRGDRAGWNCVEWVREALHTLESDGRALSTSIAVWETVRDGAMRYAAFKRAQNRFDGQGNFDRSKVPTYDLIEGKEIVA